MPESAAYEMRWYLKTAWYSGLCGPNCACSLSAFLMKR